MTSDLPDKFADTRPHVQAILHYVLGEKPAGYVLERYLLALEHRNGLQNLQRSPLSRKFPFLIGFIDPFKAKTQRQAALAEAVRIACFVAETDTKYVAKFCNKDQRRFWLLFTLFWRLSFDAVLLVIRVGTAKLSKTTLPKPNGGDNA